MTTDEPPAMTAEGTLSRFPYLISVRGGRPVPARKDGHYYVCAYQTFLGLWSPREVTVLQYDPRRDFLREQRQAHLDAHATPPADSSTDRSPSEDVNTRPAASRPAPTWDPAPEASRTPGWGR